MNKIFLVVLVAFCFCMSSAFAEKVTLADIADTHVLLYNAFDYPHTEQYCRGDSLQIYDYQDFGYPYWDMTAWSYLKFAPVVLPEGATVISAKLVLHSFDAGSSWVAVYNTTDNSTKYDYPWEEGFYPSQDDNCLRSDNANWSEPIVAPIDMLQDNMTAVNGDNFYDVTGAVVSALSEGRNVSLTIRTNYLGHTQFCSKELNPTYCTNSSWTPYVLVEYELPAPSMIVSTLTDVGSGMGNFISAIQDPIVDFFMSLAFIGAVLSIFMAIAYAVKGALNR